MFLLPKHPINHIRRIKIMNILTLITLVPICATMPVFSLRTITALLGLTGPPLSTEPSSYLPTSSPTSFPSVPVSSHKRSALAPSGPSPTGSRVRRDYYYDVTLGSGRHTPAPGSHDGENLDYLYPYFPGPDKKTYWDHQHMSSAVFTPAYSDAPQGWETRIQQWIERNPYTEPSAAPAQPDSTVKPKYDEHRPPQVEYDPNHADDEAGYIDDEPEYAEDRGVITHKDEPTTSINAASVTTAPASTDEARAEKAIMQPHTLVIHAEYDDHPQSMAVNCGDHLEIYDGHFVCKSPSKVTNSERSVEKHAQKTKRSVPSPEPAFGIPDKMMDSFVDMTFNFLKVHAEKSNRTNSSGPALPYSRKFVKEFLHASTSIIMHGVSQVDSNATSSVNTTVPPHIIHNSVNETMAFIQKVISEESNEADSPRRPNRKAEHRLAFEQTVRANVYKTLVWLLDEAQKPERSINMPDKEMEKLFHMGLDMLQGLELLTNPAKSNGTEHSSSRSAPSLNSTASTNSSSH